MSNNSLNSPGVFRGQARLATQQDIANLKEYLERIIAGPLNELNDNGYIPWKYNADGTLDIDYLFPELISRFSAQQGISISKNGVKFVNNVTSFNVQGKFVSLDIDENGCLTWTIDEPQVTIPNFNEANMFSSALVEIENEIIEDMIVPDYSGMGGNSPYGDWEPGTKVKGINWNRDATYDVLKLTTKGKIYAETTESYFEVIVLDGSNGTFASFVSAPISASTRGRVPLQAASSQNSQHIEIYIDDFKEEARGYSFIPRFELNLARIIGSSNGGRFSVKLIHHDSSAYTYTSDDLLYNCGSLPVIENNGINSISVQLLNDSSSPSSEQLKSKYCSGVKYANAGTVVVRLNSVRNLNNMAAVDNPISYSFGISDPEEEELIYENYDLDYMKTASFKIKFKLKENAFNNSMISGWAKAKNAFGECNEVHIPLPILLNSQTQLKESDRLHEYFTDESFRVLSDFELNSSSIGEYSDLVSWDSTKSLIDYDNGQGLMVIPGQGLSYPFGNWDSFYPVGSPDYSQASFLSNEKCFARVFSGNEKTKFGGIFVFEGLTKNQFFDTRLTILISCTRGIRWFNLKQIRNMNSIILREDGTAVDATGIMTSVEEKDNKLFVEWAYPTSVSSNQPLYFKLSMKKTSPFMIKSISLLNSDEEEDW